MNRTFIIGSVATAAMIAAVVYFFLGASPTNPGSEAPPAEELAASSNGASQAPLPSQSSMPSGAGSIRALDQVKTLSALSRIANASTEHRGQALTELRLAAVGCDTLRIRTSMPTRLELERRARGETDLGLQAWQRFCDSQAESTDLLHRAQLALPENDEVTQAMGLRLMSIEKPSEDAAPLAEELVNKAKDPLAVEAAADMLFRLDRDLPQTKVVPFPSTIQSRELQVEAQRLALEMYTCQVRGGCGPDGLYTLLRCGQPCSRGHVTSLSDLWSRKYPAEVVAYARSLSSMIATQRR